MTSSSLQYVVSVSVSDYVEIDVLSSQNVSSD